MPPPSVPSRIDPSAAPDNGAPRVARPPAWEAAREGAVVTRDSGFAPLVIAGRDAEAFLQGQLSNDVRVLAAGHGHWTSYNSPKGRMLATLFLVRWAADRFGAFVADDLAEAFRRRLAMFVLRSSVAIEDAGATHRVLGVGGPAAREALRSALGVDVGAGQATRGDDCEIVRLPDGRALVVVARDRAEAVVAVLQRFATPVEAAVWDWLGVRTGVPAITAATQDRFVAQTANWDAVGGLDFRKGCYPGQEIVARTQYLGRLKERLFAFSFDAEAPAPGTPLYGEPFGDQAAGTVVNSAPSPGGGSVFLAVVQTAAAEHGALAVGAPDGPHAAREALPYAVPEPAAPRRKP